MKCYVLNKSLKFGLKYKVLIKLCVLSYVLIC